MKVPRSKLLTALAVMSLLAAGCAGAASTPTRTPQPERTERPSNYSLTNNWSRPGEHQYRGFIQVPNGMALGPDGNTP